MSLLTHFSVKQLFSSWARKEEFNPRQSSRVLLAPTPAAFHQWGVKAQQDLAHYEKTGKLPEGMFKFD
ncbi:MAG: hypothetical protein RIS84_1571 [Pseudomonadota bacterium]|jgi:hypothetical protein